ncbi:hypothetical protein B9W68_13110 [Streptomyces sp. CS227]|uniref:hypothetical protein n=1 Tax=Streptomyces sp. CS227 TaxID=1982763 RepID=UPI000B409387|nr:hypothetical protein [Streptomyces sp. CS227]OWA13095.1 hypothetical protein B9W68_13110 [Streptomyces sp. CS227]
MNKLARIASALTLAGAALSASGTAQALDLPGLPGPDGLSVLSGQDELLSGEQTTLAPVAGLVGAGGIGVGTGS